MKINDFSSNAICRIAKFAILLCLALVAGCGGDAAPEIPSQYAQARGESVNGLNVLASILQNMGHDVRFANRVNDDVSIFADVIIRVSKSSGPVPIEEAEWFDRFLIDTPDGWVVYAPYDANMLFEYWEAAELQAEKAGQTELAKKRQNRKMGIRSSLESQVAANDNNKAAPNWFRVVGDKETRYEPGADWQGPLAFDGIRWNLHQTLDDMNGEILLSCSKGAVIIRRGPRIFTANAGLFLNAGLVDASRRELLDRLFEEMQLNVEPRSIVILVGTDIFAFEDSSNALWRFLTTWPTSALAAHLLLIGVVGCWYKAIRRGPECRIVSQNWTLISNHARAVGHMLVQSDGFERKSREILQKYAGWRSTSFSKRLFEQNRQEFHENQNGGKQ